jgi:hypothetical protein
VVDAAVPLPASTLSKRPLMVSCVAVPALFINEITSVPDNGPSACLNVPSYTPGLKPAPHVSSPPPSVGIPASRHFSTLAVSRAFTVWAARVNSTDVLPVSVTMTSYRVLSVGHTRRPGFVEPSSQV